MENLDSVCWGRRTVHGESGPCRKEDVVVEVSGRAAMVRQALVASVSRIEESIGFVECSDIMDEKIPTSQRCWGL